MKFKYKIKFTHKHKYGAKHGLQLNILDLTGKSFAYNNKYIKYLEKDKRLFNILIFSEHAIKPLKINKHIGINRKTGEIDYYTNILNNYNYVDWMCAYCNIPIKCNINEHDIKNFVCKKCYNYYIKNNKKIDKVVVESYLDFIAYNKNTYLDKQKKYLKYINKNKKIESKLNG